MNTHCIFQTPWWLEAAAPGTWKAIEIEKDTQVVARLPYCFRQEKSLNLISAPPYTHTLGPWLAPAASNIKYAKFLSQQKELLTELIEQLPPHDYFAQKCHQSFNNWLPFHWQGFSQTTAYTYILEDLSDLDQIWSNFQENVRREVRKAQKQLKVKVSDDVEYLYKLNCRVFERQNIPYPRQSTLERFRSIDQACVEQRCRRIFFAEDAEGNIHAALYLVWDNHSAYYLIGGADNAFRTTGGMSLLMWEAIQFAATVTKQFDFVGSMNESIERFVRGFGPRQVPYFVLTRMSRRMKILMAGRDILSAIRG
jgi:lipid II:glycine glycyltransferase (peptidoglycan interpeptide bridge formation enzyme)